MTLSFEKRQTGYESKFVHDAELTFRTGARRNRRPGPRAAELMSRSGVEAGARAGALPAIAPEESGGGRTSTVRRGAGGPRQDGALLPEAWQELREGQRERGADKGCGRRGLRPYLGYTRRQAERHTYEHI
ncbi:MAG TPA: DUF1476 family protein [Paracoccus sp.]|nr:DUF1476 family protein [Paracoccus sp. (in: a-proteobacteria)]